MKYKLSTFQFRNAASGWNLTNHACRHCLGRLLTRQVDVVKVETKCAECEASVTGEHEALCCCGVECGSLGKVLECYVNDHAGKSIPQAILVRERART